MRANDLAGLFPAGRAGFFTGVPVTRLVFDENGEGRGMFVIVCQVVGLGWVKSQIYEEGTGIIAVKTVLSRLNPGPPINLLMAYYA